ncbi:hypothetical protein J6500_13290 [Bradyrhizobium sp. WSM 1704]|uniref:hypothetical protein n=1 Tax=Bradyrhizobium semiaridum TaxID=2821404 RepID=UPI001CE2C42B|nr:hypothetical protein [Bradyrhizobium semiaridum]MCA6122865.1 hypothetical protein [Bradyrhizobium semiaridum]
MGSAAVGAGLLLGTAIGQEPLPVKIVVTQQLEMTMTNERDSEKQAANERHQRKGGPPPERTPPQGGPPVHDGLEQVRDCHT